MDNIQSIRQNYINAYNFIKSCGIVEPNITQSAEVITKVNELSNEYNFPLELKMILYTMGSLQIKIHHDSGFEFISLNEMNKHKYEKFIDLGILYGGMGWYYVLSWNKTNKKMFFRLEGGSNGYDVYYNHLYYFGTSKYPAIFDSDNDEFNDKMLTFKDAIDCIINNKISDVAIHANFDKIKISTSEMLEDMGV